jgi:hypothetical protein
MYTMLHLCNLQEEVNVEKLLSDRTCKDVARIILAYLDTSARDKRKYEKRHKRHVMLQVKKAVRDADEKEDMREVDQFTGDIIAQINRMTDGIDDKVDEYMYINPIQLAPKAYKLFESDDGNCLNVQPMMMQGAFMDFLLANPLRVNELIVYGGQVAFSTASTLTYEQKCKMIARFKITK